MSEVEFDVKHELKQIEELTTNVIEDWEYVENKLSNNIEKMTKKFSKKILTILLDSAEEPDMLTKLISQIQKDKDQAKEYELSLTSKIKKIEGINIFDFQSKKKIKKSRDTLVNS
jgi:uncharacterized coiled-coil protein SlyX